VALCFVFNAIRKASEMNCGQCEILSARWHTSSKTRSACGATKKELAMSKRAYICEECGSEMDRNMNAAINIREQAKRLIGLAWRTDLAVVSIAYAYR